MREDHRVLLLLLPLMAVREMGRNLFLVPSQWTSLQEKLIYEPSAHTCIQNAMYIATRSLKLYARTTTTTRHEATHVLQGNDMPFTGSYSPNLRVWVAHPNCLNSSVCCSRTIGGVSYLSETEKLHGWNKIYSITFSLHWAEEGRQQVNLRYGLRYSYELICLTNLGLI